MKTLIIGMLLIASVAGVPNLVGFSETEIKEYMKENEKIFVYQNITNNSTFKYLKYTDRSETQTLLFFLDTELKCKAVRLVCEKSLRSQKVKELDSQFRKTSGNTWIETKNGKDYLIELREEDTTFNITIQKNDKN